MIGNFMKAAAATAIVTGLLAASVPATALAQTQTAQSCLAAQTRAAGRVCSGVGRCYVKAMKKGTTLDQACVDQRELRLAFSFDEIELLGRCLVEGAATDVFTLIDDGQSSHASSIGLDAGKCGAKKMGAVAKLCSGLLRCYAKAAGQSQSGPDPACTDKHTAVLSKLFSKAARKGPCAGDQAALQESVESLADSVFMTVRGSDTTTTTTSTSTSSSTVTTTTTSTSTSSSTVTTMP
jgi:hypothetical protein